MTRKRHQTTAVGRIDVTSLLLRDRRVTVRIYLPPDYEWTDQPYPVLFMFDGHNLFDTRTSTYNQEWQVDETMERLAEQGEQAAIVVGIDAPQDRYERYAMYSIGPWEFRQRPAGRALREIEGFGEQTAAFLMTEVRSYVNERYRVRQDRDGVGVAGSSMGGYMSLFTAAAYPDLVGRVMAFSPVVLDHPMAGHRLRDYLAERGGSEAQRIYLDMGDNEELPYIESPEDLVANLWALASTLQAAGQSDLVARVVPGGDHSERSWGARFEEAYRWAFLNGPVPG